MTATINTRLALFGIGMFAALSASSHAASYAEFLFGEKFEAHIRVMGADGITRKDAVTRLRCLGTRFVRTMWRSLVSEEPGSWQLSAIAQGDIAAADGCRSAYARL